MTDPDVLSVSGGRGSDAQSPAQYGATLWHDLPDVPHPGLQYLSGYPQGTRSSYYRALEARGSVLSRAVSAPVPGHSYTITPALSHPRDQREKLSRQCPKGAPY